MSLEAKLERLLSILRPLGRALVAYSGGVDSTLLASAAFEALGRGAVAVTADSPSIPRSQLDEARRTAASIGIRHIVIETRELEDPAYASNPVNRCYFCKLELFSRLEPLGRGLGIPNFLYGAIVDDRGDFRPGQTAAREKGILAPLDMAGLTKAEIRELSRHRGLPSWDKPASPCLSSRLPYGTPVTREALSMVEAAEEHLRSLGFREFRVRHYGERASIEIASAEMPRLRDAGFRERTLAGVLGAGYRRASFEASGFRSGRLNPD